MGIGRMAMDEALLIDEIALAWRDKFYNEEAAGEFPNLGLIIRDALYEYVRRAAEDAEGRK